MKANKALKKEYRTKDFWNVYSITFFILLSIYALTIFFSLGWMLMTTFKHTAHYMEDKLGFPDFSYFQKLPYGIFNEQEQWIGETSSIFANYITMFGHLSYKANTSYIVGMFNKQEIILRDQYFGVSALLVFLGNSVWQVLAGTVLPMGACCLMGYMTAKYKYKFSYFIYALVVFTMAMPVYGSTAVMITLLRSLRLFNTIPGFLIQNFNWTSMYYLVFYSYFVGMSDSYIEAAEIDGASQFRVLTTIAFPLASNMLLATCIVMFVGVWNDYSTALMYLPSYPPMALGIYLNASGSGIHAPIKFATLMYLAVPAAVFFVAFRKKLMGNISIGGIKE